MVEINIRNFDLEQIAKSGQAFRFEKLSGDTYAVVAFGKYLKLKQEGSNFCFYCSCEEFETIWKSYFDLERDYSKIGDRIYETGNDYLIASYNKGSGIRILRQELWEMCITFLISQNNNIKRITNSVAYICEHSGNRKYDEQGDIYYTFPTEYELTDEVLLRKEAGLGYRTAYLQKFKDYAVTTPGWKDYLKKLPYDEAKRELMSHTGIGNKVADCICLFGLNHVEAFPVDTHIRQIMDTYFKNGFPLETFDGVAGIVQQYIFYNKISA